MKGDTPRRMFAADNIHYIVAHKMIVY